MKTILLIDDEAEMLRDYPKLLERRGIKTLTAPNGEEGIRLYKENNPCGVLLDLHLSEMTGVEVLKKLKEINPQVKVYLITGDLVFAEKNPAESIGATGYLVKPIYPQDLLKVIESF